MGKTNHRTFSVLAVSLFFVVSFLSTVSFAESIHSEVIYGADGRLDYYQINNPSLLFLADSTALMVSHANLRNNADGSVHLRAKTYGKRNDLCVGEPFYSQPALIKRLLFFSVSDCSSFLVGEDLVATAGHCFFLSSCADSSFVFGYRMNDAKKAVVDFPRLDIYQCKKIVAKAFSLWNGPDFALVKLDRPMRGRKPIKLASTPAQAGEALGILVDGESAMNISYIIDAMKRLKKSP